jgi:hypothetical protein
MVGAFITRTFSRSSRGRIDLGQKVKVGRVIPTSHMGQNLPKLDVRVTPLSAG